jgi:hypothetical protein
MIYLLQSELGADKHHRRLTFPPTHDSAARSGSDGPISCCSRSEAVARSPTRTRGFVDALTLDCRQK